MATVADLITELDRKLLPYSGSHKANAEDAKIRALNAGKNQVWKALVAAGRETGANWFGESTTVAFGSAAVEANLPSDCHNVLSVHVAGAVCRPSGWHKQNWRDQQSESSAFSSLSAADELLWQVYGGVTPKLVFARGVSGGFTATVHYTQHLAIWDETGDSVDTIPEPYHETIVNYAAATLVNAAQDPAVAGIWRDLFASGIELVSGSGQQRQLGGVVTPEDYDSVA